MPADPGFTQLRTARLVIRRFHSQDLAVFAAYRSDPDVAKYQSWETYTVQEAEEFLRDHKGKRLLRFAEVNRTVLDGLE